MSISRKSFVRNAEGGVPYKTLFLTKIEAFGHAFRVPTRFIRK